MAENLLQWSEETSGSSRPPPPLIIPRSGRYDGVVQLNSGEIYQRSIRDSRLVVLEHCGHRPEIAKSAEFIETVRSFLA